MIPLPAQASSSILFGNFVEFAVVLNDVGVERRVSSRQSARQHFSQSIEDTWPIHIDQWRFGAASVHHVKSPI